MAYTLNRRLAQLVDSNGQLNTGKIPNDYITSDHIADNTITSAMLHTSFTVSTSNLTAIDTDDVSEGTSNLYFTNARADARIAAATTDDLTEGSTNLYFTNARIDSHLSGGTGVTYSSGAISIGQDVGTSATPTFGNITTTGYIAGPATFTIDPAAVGDNTGTVVIAGNLQVDGTTTTINSTTVNVDDLNIQLATGAANAAAANGAGITVDGASATITYDGTNDEWDFNKNINVTGKVIASNWYQGASSTNTLYSSTSQGTIIQTPSNTNNAAGTFYIRDSLGNVHFELNTNTNVVDIAGTLDITSSGAHLKFTRSSFDTLQFGTGTGNSISGLHLTNTTDSTVPFSIDENAPDGSLTLSDGGGLSVGGESAAQALSLYGSDHVYMGWYPTSGAGRKAYAGFNSAGTTTFTLYNEAGGGAMNLVTLGSTTIDAGGEIILSADDNGEIVLKDGSLHYGTLLEDNSNFILRSAINDEDIIFQGYDNGGLFTALTLDMSEAGDAYFNRRISVGGVITNTSANADDIVIGSYNDATERGITFASTTGGGIRWNDAADAAVIQYSHSSNEMYYSSTSHHRFVATTGDTAGLVRINTNNAGAGVLHVKAANATEDGYGSISIESPNSAMRIGGTDGRSWIQSHGSQPLYINKLGNNVIFNADGGNVGIGTTSPAKNLEIFGSGSESGILVKNDTNTNYRGYYISSVESDNTAYGKLHMDVNSGELNITSGYSGWGGFITFDTNGSESMRIDGSGDLRVGTASLGFDFDISTQMLSTNFGTSGNLTLAVTNSSGVVDGGAIFLGGRTRGDSLKNCIVFSNGSNAEKMRIKEDGELYLQSGLITINNNSAYQVRSATGGAVLRGAAVHHLITHDHRTPLYNSMTHGHMGFGFTSYALNNTSPWADIIYLNSYTDSSGGSPNAIVISRSASNCKVVRYAWSSTSSTAISNGAQYALAGSTSSDQRLKENVVNITNGLDTIKALRPVTFNWTDEFLQAGLSKNETEIEADENGALIAPETKVENVGLIAQEVEEVLPTIIHENEISFGGTDYKTIHYDKLVPHLIAAIKEQDTTIQDLKSRIETLEG